jgi:cell division protein FtsB
MRELQRKQKLKKRMYSVPVLVAFLLVVLLTARGTYSVLKKKHDSEVYVKNLQRETQDLNNRQAELENSVTYLKTEEGIDQEIKQRFNVEKPGEHVVVIVDPKQTSTTTTQENSTWWKSLWDAIIGFL